MVDLKTLQVNLPWTAHYHRDFRNSPMSHKDFGHALLHVQKAAGKLAAVVNDAEHGGSEFTPEEVDPYIADLVICALRMANTCPGRTIDLEKAVVERIETKNCIKQAEFHPRTGRMKSATSRDQHLQEPYGSAPSALAENILRFSPPGSVTLTQSHRDELVKTLASLRGQLFRSGGGL